jgi:hypothetical protein
MRALRAGLIALCWCSAALACAVPDRLDAYSRPLSRIYHDFVRQESRLASNKPYVRSVVRYGDLRGSALWKQYIHDLAYVDKIGLREAQENARKAFWINAYNSFAMDAVASSYPLPYTTTNDYPAGSFRGSAAWNGPHYVAAGSYTLDSIRELLSAMRDPRIVFALNEAAVSSPALPEIPYDATNVEQQLDAATANFLADPLNYRIDRTRNRLLLSQLFRTNAQLFLDSTATIAPTATNYPTDVRGVITFLLQHVSTENREYIQRKRPAIEYQPFIWDLNEAR